jgi:hypothetical protein
MSRLSASIIITNFNYDDFLPRSVGSALAQDYGPVQVIVVDDRSTDASEEVIRGFGDRITAVMKPVNEGHGAAMNSGFAASTGDLILLLDADDYLYPNAVSAIVASFLPEAALYQYRLDLVGREGDRLDVYPPRETMMEYGDVRPQLCARGRFSTTVTSGLAFPRCVLQQVLPMPGDDFRQGGDGYLATVAPLHGCVVTVPGVLGAYCQHGANHSQFDRAVAQRARWRMSHDEMRYRELRRQAALLGLAVAGEPGLSDHIHLGERIASLVLDRRQHPYAGDTPAQIGDRARTALRSAPISVKRRRMLRLWWWFVSLAPRSMAGPVITWTMSAGSRPPWVDKIAKLARRLTRPG